MLAAGAVVAAFFLLGPLLRIPLHLPLSLGYNEGWNAYFARRAVDPAAGPLYPPAGALVFNNYPPMSFYVVGLFGRYVVGDMIVAGRIVAATSLLLSAALLALCVRRLGGRSRGAIAAALLALLYVAVVFRRYVAADEPQWLGHALELGGLLVLLGGRETGQFAAGRIAAAALLMTAAGLVKHLLVGLPLAVTLFLLLADRRAAAIWLAAAAAAVGAAVLLTGLLDGPDAFTDILRHRRVYDWVRVLEASARLLPALLPMLVIAVVAVRERGAADARWRFVGLFVLLSLVTGLVERAGDGVNYNAHFETLLACCLLSGLAISRPPSPSRRGLAVGPTLLAVVAALPLLVFVPLGTARAWQDITGSRAREAAWRPVIARIAAAPGIAGCETLSLCFWAGKPYAVDMFNLEQDIRTGGSIARFDDLARLHRFGVFEFSGAVVRRGDLLLQDLLRRGYRVAFAGPQGSVLLMPARR